MLANVVANVGLLLVKLIIVLMFGTNIVLNQDYNKFNQQQTNIGNNICQHITGALAHHRTHNTTPLTIMGKISWWTTFLTTILFGTTLSFRPEGAIMKIWQKIVFNQIIFLFFWEILDLVYTNMTPNKMRNIPALKECNSPDASLVFQFWLKDIQM